MYKIDMYMIDIVDPRHNSNYGGKRMKEEFLKRFGPPSKMGFMRFLVLSILEEKSLHGYKIIEEIKNRTLGFFSPPSSTIYPLLKKLSEENLIEQIQTENPEDTKKVYQITTDGKEKLQYMIELQQEKFKVMSKFMSETLGMELPPGMKNGDFKNFPFKGPLFGRLNGLSKEEKIKMLEVRREFLMKRIEWIDEQLEELKK